MKTGALYILKIEVNLWKYSRAVKNYRVPLFFSEQRSNWRVAGAGYGIHWPDIDEDLSTQGLLRGSPAPKGAARAA
jgi:hypothetical protein